MNVYEIETTSCRTTPHFVVAKDFGHAQQLFMFEYPQAIITQITMKSEKVIIPGKDIKITVAETCKWTSTGQEPFCKTPHTTGLWSSREMTFCPYCGKKIEVVK
jgi:hypothetical protein